MWLETVAESLALHTATRTPTAQAPIHPRHVTCSPTGAIATWPDSTLEGALTSSAHHHRYELASGASRAQLCARLPRLLLVRTRTVAHWRKCFSEDTDPPENLCELSSFLGHRVCSGDWLHC